MPPGSTVTGVIGRFPSIDISPVVEGGRYPVKAVVGETFPVAVTAFREGHDAMSVEVQFVPPGFGEQDFVIGEPDGPLLRLHEVGPTQPDRWTVDAQLDREGDWDFYIITAGDPYETWKHKAEIKLPAGIDVELELEEGARVLGRAAAQAGTTHARKVLTEAAAAMRDTAETAAQRLYAAEAPAVQAALSEFPLRERPHRSGPWPVRVERPRALYGAWYEFFPRSEGATLNPPRSGTFRTAAKRLPAVAAMGFDVVYLPPIHPIGHTFRKGPNNTLTPGPGDPGSPWAIGSEAGGHDTVHPDLGTMADFEHFMSVAADNGLEVALDFVHDASRDDGSNKGEPVDVNSADGNSRENPPENSSGEVPPEFRFRSILANGECPRRSPRRTRPLRCHLHISASTQGRVAFADGASLRYSARLRRTRAIGLPAGYPTVIAGILSASGSAYCAALARLADPLLGSTADPLGSAGCSASGANGCSSSGWAGCSASGSAGCSASGVDGCKCKRMITPLFGRIGCLNFGCLARQP